MAKKKKRHSNQRERGPRGGASTTTTTRKDSDDTLFGQETIKPTPASPGGPNRLARKEEARKERERLRRKIARRRYYRRTWQVAVALVVIGALIFLFTRPKAKLSADDQKLYDQGTAAATLTAAGCDAVATVPPYSPESNARAHINPPGAVTTPPPLTTYSSIPPASGPHNQTPLAGGVYSDPPDIYQTIHSLEHGAVIIWYDPSAGTTQELADLQTFFQKSGEGAKVIVAPYSYPDQGDAATLPSGDQMVLVAWHRMQTCSRVSLPVAFAFVANYDSAGKGTYKGEAPEPTAAL
jgi:hypothetical protein